MDWVREFFFFFLFRFGFGESRRDLLVLSFWFLFSLAGYRIGSTLTLNALLLYHDRSFFYVFIGRVAV